MIPLRIAALVLAAGKSSRMGTPKALLPFGETPCLSLILQTLNEAFIERILIVVVLGHHKNQLFKIVRSHACQGVINPDPDRGRSSSIKAGLQFLPPVDGFLLCSVDYPLVSALDILALKTSFCIQHSKRIFLPVWQGKRGHPALFDQSLIPEFLALGDDEPAYTIVQRHSDDIKDVPVWTDGVLMNMNTPQDYERCKEIWQIRKEKLLF